MKNRRHAFTLIELLTVIAIIGILAAILVPTVGKVRDTAKDAKCKAQLREIGSACQIYAQENRQALPFYTADNPWTFYLEPYFNSKRPASNVYSNSSVVFCPGSTIAAPSPDKGFPRTYSGNPFVIARRTGSTDTTTPAVSLTKVRRPSETVFFADGIQVNPSSGSATSALVELGVWKSRPALTANSENPIDRSLNVDTLEGGATLTGGHLRYRHGEKANVVFGDGSVRSFVQQQLRERNFAIDY